jgi:photosystem II PsbZ protein
MIDIIQSLVLLLIVVSFVIIVSVPVMLATPGVWDKSQGLVRAGFALWVIVLILIGGLNSLVV